MNKELLNCEAGLAQRDARHPALRSGGLWSAGPMPSVCVRRRITPWSPWQDLKGPIPPTGAT